MTSYQREMADVSDKPCLLLIRFESSDFKAYRNSIKRGKSVLHNYGGCEVAISPRIGVVEGNMQDKYGVGVLSFPRVHQAEMWLSSESWIRQQDWLGGIDIICIPLGRCESDKQPNPECNFWVVSQIERFDMSRAAELAPFKDIHEQNGAHVITGATDVLKWRGVWSPTKLAVIQWPSMDTLKAFIDKEEAKQAKSVLHSLADITTMVFEHEDIGSPPASPTMRRRDW